MAFSYYWAQASVDAERAKETAQQVLEQQQQEASIPKAQRDSVWQRVHAHERFVGDVLTVRQVLKNGILASHDQDTDHPGQYYFVKDFAFASKLYTGSSPQFVGPPLYEIGTYAYTTVTGANATLPCLTCSSNVAFAYYLKH
jgi:hypothetical protein